MRKLLVTVIALAFGILAGWASARIMIERTTQSAGAAVAGWQELRVEPDSLGELYQTGSFLARGQLPPPSDVRMFVRSRDDEGNTLRSDCATRIEGQPPSARWWQLSAVPRSGVHALSSGAIVPEPEGRYIVTAWNTALAGNWLPLEGNGDYALRLIVHDVLGDEDAAIPLPAVRRQWC